MLNLKFQFPEPDRVAWSDSFSLVIVSLLFGLGYYLAGETGLLIDTGYRGVTPFWPSSGLSLLVFILFGPRYWPGIFIGIGILAYRFDMPWDVAFLAAAGHVLEALTGWYLVNRFRIQLTFRRVAEVLNFSALAFIASLISSTFGSLAMSVAMVSNWSDFIFIWSMWWLGDAVGILLIVPFFMVWRNLLFHCSIIRTETSSDIELVNDCLYILQPNRVGQFAVYILLLVLISIYSFSSIEIHATGKLALFYLIMPLTVFIAVSFEQPGATLATVIVSIVLLFSYHPGWGLFSVEQGVLNLVTVIVFISITFITSMMVAALFVERRATEKNLRKSHHRLQESELRLRQLSENINEVFWLTDVGDDHVIYVSPSVKDVWGKGCEEFYNNPDGWIQSIHEEDINRVTREYQDFKRTGKFDTEYRIIRPDGEIRWVHDKGFPVFNEAGRIYRLAGIAEDITESKKAQEEHQQQQEERARLSRYISVGELGTSLAHEINQPLTSIMCYANGGLNRVRNGRLSKEDMEEVFERLSSEAERAGRIINKLRDFVNRKEMKFSSVDINEILQESIRLVENKIKNNDIKLIYVLAKSLPLILVDSVLTQQVILNLVINAIESMQEVKIDRVLTIMTELNDNHIKVSFRDTGAGVPVEVRDEIFTPLFTTKKHGIGLGLPIANTIIESMGGELRAYPVEGPGYVFEFELPMSGSSDRSYNAVSDRD